MGDNQCIYIPAGGEAAFVRAARCAWRIGQEAGLDPVSCAKLAAAAMAIGATAREGVRFAQQPPPDHTLRISAVPEDSGSVRLFALPDAVHLREPDAATAGDDLSAISTGILRALDEGSEAAGELRNAHAALAAIESELEETNRGVLALYSELDERADRLRRADELKSRFLSYASHELRTPLNGIIGLVRLLTNARPDRSGEELKQLSFIQRAAEEMREMVNDLLDLAKVEAGKVTVQPTEFGLEFVFGALRGIFRPLLQTDDVVLRFEDTSAVPSIYSDEAKVSQILRNLISNALKFTEHGEVRVWAEAQDETVGISVRDTGIGIAPQNLERIFEEYAQIEHPLQKRVRGTGLGLPLCRRLAELLGGHVEVESELGKGSTFTVVLPLEFRGGGVTRNIQQRVTAVPEQPPTILIIDDAEIDRYLLVQLLSASGDFRIIEAEDGEAGRDCWLRDRPDFVFLDLGLPKIEGTRLLSEVRANPQTRETPVAVVTARTLSDQERRGFEEAAIPVFDKARLASARKLNVRFSHRGANVDVVY